MLFSVNHSAPSGPDAIAVGLLNLVGTANPVIVPLCVTSPIFPPFCSTNHVLPSGPTVISPGWLPAVEIGNSVTMRVVADADPPASTTNPAATSMTRAVLPVRDLIAEPPTRTTNLPA